VTISPSLSGINGATAPERVPIITCLSMSDNLKFKHSFTCIISGPSGSGKSSFCMRFLQNLDTLCTERNFDGDVIWCYSEKTAVPSTTVLPKNFRFNEGVPADFENGRGRPCLVILDHLLKDVYSKQVCDLFTKGSQHRNNSVILITQNLLHQSRFCREISLQLCGPITKHQGQESVYVLSEASLPREQ